MNIKYHKHKLLVRIHYWLANLLTTKQIFIYTSYNCHEIRIFWRYREPAIAEPAWLWESWGTTKKRDWKRSNQLNNLTGLLLLKKLHLLRKLFPPFVERSCRSESVANYWQFLLPQERKSLFSFSQMTQKLSFLDCTKKEARRAFGRREGTADSQIQKKLHVCEQRDLNWSNGNCVSKIHTMFNWYKINNLLKVFRGWMHR